MQSSETGSKRPPSQKKGGGTSKRGAPANPPPFVEGLGPPKKLLVAPVPLSLETREAPGEGAAACLD